MPELPEVEITRQGISPFLLYQTITATVIRHQQLRLVVPPDLQQRCVGKQVKAISRRAKYLLFELSEGFLLNHLGMSGHLRIVTQDVAPGKHDHLDLILSNGKVLRYNDPRRFGLWLYIEKNPDHHPLLAHLGPEPLSETFNPTYLFSRARGKTQNIKAFIMRNDIVVGVGNIYATESLFKAGIHPLTAAGRVTFADFAKLAPSIKQVLQQAIHAGGTTLRDFYAADGKPGYFVNKLQVYGRKNMPCYQCSTTVETVTIAGRTSAFCPVCQPKT
ncbi:bifunctional DNA-formamidopyrimidine glycosylase/DNA-(apurinic or apyrimidinic site) lyase [Legionella maceachernii]|uniref:Formamidopyrimidine-DNA glycosylase n=3 Tax=Legionella TaxID=445 RepID=A0A0W0W6R6_9GAMM|nr:bifunctional DNA-formamidopyrimidine glycosylase/DNA-(apurinic or apyrimidinic site) lyase [Legionella maceachernii]KTD28029.1 formamidopyrimidine-DNA glycosylase [Legionella maceachernii]SKA07124.1 DNA-(apurinic or apyrimidinic site) lyase [Legionella maceachernii]SUO99843.1 Formamidopyrimidine-DNA glycosylase [Legionella maceachernii]